MINLSMSYHTSNEPEVRYRKRTENLDYEVQIFLGSSFQTLYMDVETARRFAEKILAALPADETVVMS